VHVQGVPPAWEAMKPLAQRGCSSSPIALASKGVTIQVLVTVTPRWGGKMVGRARKGNVGVRGGRGGGKRGMSRGKGSHGHGQICRGGSTRCHGPILPIVFQPHIGRCVTTTLFLFTNTRVYGLLLHQHLTNFPILQVLKTQQNNIYFNQHSSSSFINM